MIKKIKEFAKKYRGMTLIELLAVVVVIAIILLIVVPVFFSVIGDARKSAFRASSYGFIKTAENEYFSAEIKSGTHTTEYVFVDHVLQDGKTLNHSGKPPKDGVISVRLDGKIAIALHDGTWCATKGYEDDLVVLTELPFSQCRLPGDTGWTLTLLTNPVDSGFVYGAANYDEGTTVDILAEPYLNNTFVEWRDSENNVISLSENYSFEMPDENVTLTAVFNGSDRYEQTQYYLALQTNPSYVADYVEIEGFYNDGDQALVNVTKNSNMNEYNFIGWHDELGNVVSASELFEHKMTRDTVLTAVYSETVPTEFEHMLILRTVPSDAGFTIGNGVYNQSETVEITTDSYGSTPFLSWTGDSGEEYLNKTTSIQMPNRTKLITANYEEVSSEVIASESGHDVFCEVLAFHFEKDATTATLRLNCNGDIENVEVAYTDFEYELNDATIATGLVYSNNERTNSYECIGNVWQRTQLGDPLNWDQCIRNEYGHCSGFPKQITINDVMVQGTPTTIKLWKTNEMPYNIEPPTIYRGYHVELERTRNPLKIMEGSSCTSGTGQEVIYEAPIYKGYAGVPALHACEIREDDPFSIPAGATPWTDIVWGGGVVSHVCEHVMYLESTGGTGIINDFGNTDNMLKLPSNVTMAIFDEGIVQIGMYAFVSNKLEEVYLPETLQTINRDAFRANSIKKLRIPDSVQVIEDWAFMNNDIATLSIGSGMTIIDYASFAYNNIVNLVLPDNIESLGRQAFQYNSIETVIFGANINSIGISALQNNQLTQVTIPDTVTTLSNFAFDSNRINSLTIGTGLTSIGTYGFMRNELTSVTIPANVGTISDYAFERNYLTEVTFLRTANTVTRTVAFRNNGPLKNSTAANLDSQNADLSGTWTLSPDGTTWSR